MASKKRPYSDDEAEPQPVKRLKAPTGFVSSEDEESSESETSPVAEDAGYEKDYLECRAITRTVTDAVVRDLGGEEHQQEIEERINRGRCSFVRSYNAPPEILADNPTLKEYQVAAVHWLLSLFKHGYNGLLADDMGLGKSAESICFLKRLYAENLLDKPTIVACPTTLLDNWMQELRKWAPRLRVLRYHGSQAERRYLRRKFELGDAIEDEESGEDGADEDAAEHPSSDNEEADGESETFPLSTAMSDFPSEQENSTGREPPAEKAADIEADQIMEEAPYPLPEGVAYHILVTSHPTLANAHDRQHFFKQQEFGYLVVDEAHGLKNASSNRYQQINKSVKAPLRLLLTGSPIQNQISELKNLLGFLNPYRGKEDFILENALAYHKKLWQQAIETERERVKEQQSLPGLLADAKTEQGAPATDVVVAEDATDGSNKMAGDPEILFYQQLLSPLILRRLKPEVIHNFPQKTSKIELLDMHPQQTLLYQATLRESSSLLTSGRKSKGSSNTAIKGLIFRLRRICNHPLLLQGYFSPQDREEFAKYLQSSTKEYKKHSVERVLQYIQDWSDFDLHNEAFHHLPALQNFRIPKEEFGKSCKTNRLLELINETCVAKGEKMLVFSQFTTYLDIIQEFLNLYIPELEHLRLDGSTTVRDRDMMVSSFQNNTSDAKLFLLSTKAGGVGLNLTSSNTVVLMDQDWNPHNDRQAEDRVHRLGQTGDVTVYRLCCRHTFEESVLSCCKKKLELDEAFGGAQEALPLEIFEQILRDAQQIHETEVQQAEQRRSPKRVVQTAAAAAEKKEKKASPPPVKKTEKKIRKKKPATPPAPKHEDSLLPGGDSD